MKKITILLPFVAIVVLFSCKKNSGSSSSTPPVVEFQLKTTNRTSAINRIDAAGSIVWTSGFASITEIKLEAQDPSQQQFEYKSQINKKIDLFTPVANVIGSVTLPGGLYTALEFRFETAPSGSDAAIQIDGTFSNGNTGTATPVSFRINVPYEIKGEKSNVVILDNITTTALTSLDLSLLTAGISQAILGSATITGGTIIISSTSNIALYNIITTNLLLHHEAEIGHR